MRQLAAHTFHWLAWRTGHALRHARLIRKPRILTYHAIGDNDTPSELFAWQLSFLCQEFDMVSLPVLLDRLGQGSCNGSEVVVTFDDGVRNHATAAYPLLLAHGVPATFFVCPGLMDTGRWIWNMELRVRLRLLKYGERARLAIQFGAPDPEVETLVGFSKSLALAERQQLEALVCARTSQFEPSSAQLDRLSPMTWEQAAGLDSRLITIGSHTVSHSILTCLSQEQRRAEIVDSKHLLEQRLGRPAELFCYPNGGHDESTVEMVRSNYRGAVTTRIGFVEKGQAQALHRLPRIHAGRRTGLFMRRLHHPHA